MKFIGIIGIFVILGLAFLLSGNKKAIKPRVIFWGFGLQILFASIILSESVISWIGMYIFSLLILIYIFEEHVLINKKLSTSVLFSSGLAVAGAAVIALSWVLDIFYIAAPMAWALILAMIVLHFLKKSGYTKYVFAVLLLLTLGILFHRHILGKEIFKNFAHYVDQFLKLTDKGSLFLFGNLADPKYTNTFGFQFAFSVLPTIIFFSAVMSILYYMGIMQAIVKMMARFMKWTLGTSGAETLSCSANIFVGQTEAPLLIKPFLHDMTESELHAVMVGGFATIAGGVLAGYIRLGIDPGHLIAASVMAAPAALAMAKIIYPETEKSKTSGDVNMPQVQKADNLLDAAAQGVTDGLKLAVNVGAMLLAFIALIALIDAILGFGDKLIDYKLLGGVLNEARGEYAGFFPGSLRTLFGTMFAPLAFVMGVPWQDALNVGNLMGIKIAVNEFVGYSELAAHIKAADLSPKAIVIATYALCGFANFSSIGIQLGGIGALAPERRSTLSRVALKAMIGGALVSCLTATIAGMLV